MKPLLLSILLLAAVDAAPNVIADYRIRNPDITPALGRGYSLTSYDVLSTCLQFEEKTEPTYNYDYQMIETNSEGKHTSAVSAEMKASVGWWFIKAKIAMNMKSTSESHRHSHHISTRMATERYYSSIDDTTAKLTPDALALVERGDIVGFFQACGSGYIRSIRRTAELVAVFEFSSSSHSSSKEAAMSASFEYGSDSGSASVSSNSTKTSSDSKTKISIKAFGIGLNSEGADTLAARSLEDYDKAIKFAFKSMQNDNVGQIHGVEVVSWMNNLQFQNAVKFDRQELITWNVPIDPATGKASTTLTTKVRGVQQNLIIAANPQADPPQEAVYEPEMIESIEVKSITMINAEFITGLEAFYRKETYTGYKFQSCVGSLEDMKEAGQGGMKLQDHSQFAMVSTAAANNAATQITVDEALATLSTTALAARMASLKNFVKYVYGKCASEMSRYSNDGAMTKYWWDIPECMPIDSGATTTTTGAINTDCLKGRKTFAAPTGAATGTAPPTGTATPTGPATCSDQNGVGVASAPSPVVAGTYNDLFLDKYCMPELKVVQ